MKKTHFLNQEEKNIIKDVLFEHGIDRTKELKSLVYILNSFLFFFHLLFYTFIIFFTVFCTTIFSNYIFNNNTFLFITDLTKTTNILFNYLVLFCFIFILILPVVLFMLLKVIDIYEMEKILEKIKEIKKYE